MFSNTSSIRRCLETDLKVYDSFFFQAARNEPVFDNNAHDELVARDEECLKRDDFVTARLRGALDLFAVLTGRDIYESLSNECSLFLAM